MKKLLVMAGLLLVLLGCVEPSVKDCGTDMGCFVDATTSCGLAKVEWTSSIDLFFMKQTSTIYLETKGLDENGKCELYIEGKSFEFEFPAEVPESAKEEAESAMKAFEGKGGTCKIDPIHFTELVANWDEGSFSSEDFAGVECEGEYFDLLSN
ncbi:hypothetical protein KAW38_00675 [Candidatus Micrarchaeota archaeon]|nr:hypothetical protein [Candidatus Micrarchaeota archaeon]